MLYRNRFLVLCLCVLVQDLHCMAVSKKPKACDKQARQISNRINSAAKDFKYITRSFNCNVQYIFDAAYGEFYSNVDALRKAFERNAGKCKEDHDFTILNEQPYDVCYTNNLLKEQYAKFHRWEKEVNEICEHCGLNNDHDCIRGLREMSTELEEFKSTINEVVKKIEKDVGDCVAETEEKVKKTLENLKLKFNSCV